MNTPILFIIFNRPDTTAKVFEAIRQARPKQLFIAADGPRKNKTGEEKKCLAARSVAAQVDWNCEVQTLYRDTNLGCGLGPANAISWFFSHVDQGIILEDDCLPSPSFFQFCEELLEKYKNDNQVFLISGSNPLQEYKTDTSYIFSKYAGIWGWATWKRAWNNYDFSMSSWSNPDNKQKLKTYFKGNESGDHFIESFEKTYEGKDVTWWDYQWLYCRVINNSIGIVPSKNLIQNIGFGENASHTFDPESALAKLSASNIEWPLIHPLKKIDKKFDSINYKLFYKRNTSITRILKNRISGLIHKFMKVND